MTEDDERELDLDTLPPFPWRQEGRIVFDAEDKVVIGETCGAPTETVAATVTDCMNSLAADGWLEPVSEFMETLYNDLGTTTQKLTRCTETLRRAIELIEKFREDGTISIGSPGIKLQTPAEMLDVLHDVLTSGGANSFEERCGESP